MYSRPWKVLHRETQSERFVRPSKSSFGMGKIAQFFVRYKLKLWSVSFYDRGFVFRISHRCGGVDVAMLLLVERQSTSTVRCVNAPSWMTSGTVRCIGWGQTMRWWWWCGWLRPVNVRRIWIWAGRLNLNVGPHPVGQPDAMPTAATRPSNPRYVELVGLGQCLGLSCNPHEAIDVGDPNRGAGKQAGCVSICAHALLWARHRFESFLGRSLDVSALVVVVSDGVPM